MNKTLGSVSIEGRRGGTYKLPIYLPVGSAQKDKNDWEKSIRLI